MPVDDTDVRRACLPGCIEDVAQQWPASQRLQDLWLCRIHALTLTRGQYDDARIQYNVPNEITLNDTASTNRAQYMGCKV